MEDNITIACGLQILRSSSKKGKKRKEVGKDKIMLLFIPTFFFFMRDRKQNRSVIWLAHSTNAYHGQDWAVLELGIRHSILVSHVSSGSSVIGAGTGRLESGPEAGVKPRHLSVAHKLLNR